MDLLFYFFVVIIFALVLSISFKDSTSEVSDIYFFVFGGGLNLMIMVCSVQEIEFDDNGVQRTGNF